MSLGVKIMLKKNLYLVQEIYLGYGFSFVSIYFNVLLPCTNNQNV